MVTVTVDVRTGDTLEVTMACCQCSKVISRVITIRASECGSISHAIGLAKQIEAYCEQVSENYASVAAKVVIAIDEPIQEIGVTVQAEAILVAWLQQYGGI